MKKIALILMLGFAAEFVHAQAWTVSLNQIAGGTSDFGTKNSFPINFYTNNIQRMILGTDGVLKINGLAGTGSRFLQVDSEGKLTSWTGSSMDNQKLLYGDGIWRTPPVLSVDDKIYITPTSKFGIGTTVPATKLDVTGTVRVTGNIYAGDGVNFSNRFGLNYLPETGTRPPTMDFSFREVLPYDPEHPVFGHSVTISMPCAAFPVDSLPTTRQHNSFVAAHSFVDLMQVYHPSSNVTLNLGINNGNGVVSVDNPGAVLRINPACLNNVYIAEGGGLTKIFNSAEVIGNLKVSNNATVSHDLFVSNTIKLGVSANPDAQLDIHYAAASGLTDAFRITNPSLPGTTDFKIFEVTRTGETSIGYNLDGISSMLAVGQPQKNKLALCLTDNTSSTNKDFFKVYGNGYVEIDVNSLGIMPYNRVLAIKDASGSTSRDLFVVKNDGKVYAREVEISLVNPFPDYVFSKNYKLNTINEVADFIERNKHLPNFENGEYYEKNGVNINDLLLKQQEQLETQMLYIIQLEKRLLALEKAK